MLARKGSHKGFTLVEILIVVVILGILAAIVIPQFTNASETARASSVTSQLQSIRSQLELYQVQHNGGYPTLAQMSAGADDWDVMTLATDGSGTTGAAGAAFPFGPYLKKAPVNPFTASSLIAADPAAPAATDGWTYDEDTGILKAVIPATVTGSDLNLSTNDIVQL
jgi:type II secretion system protein G